MRHPVTLIMLVWALAVGTVVAAITVLPALEECRMWPGVSPESQAAMTLDTLHADGWRVSHVVFDRANAWMAEFCRPRLRIIR